MTTLEFCRKHVVFTRAGSPIIGPFRDEYYPFLREVFAASDDITCKRLVFLKASSSMGTVALQCMLAKRVSLDAGDILFVAQSDDDAAKFSKTRGKQFMADIGYTSRLLSREKYSVTNNLWLYRGKFVAIEGPGENNQNSQQTATVFTDESHTEAYLPGTLAAFEKRAGGKWNRKIIHATTAANIEKEITKFYFEGDQSEWHLRCPKCASLIDPIFSDMDALNEKYNGVPVFIFSDIEKSPRVICPHCQHESRDTSRDRFLLNKDGGYVMANAEASRATRSFRWPVWAMHSISWDGLLSEYRAALASARLMDLTPLEDWVKKRECRPWKNEAPDFGQTKIGAFKCGDIWVTSEDRLRTCSFDFQEGHGAEGVHWWGQVDEFTRSGASRRMKFDRLESWAACRAFQEHFQVEARDTYPDAGHRDKEVFARCAEWLWYALIASDSTEFAHTRIVGGKRVIISNPYFTQAQMQDSMSGRNASAARKGGVRVMKNSSLPAGWCLSRTWSKPKVGFLLMKLKAGELQEYGIPSDIGEHYKAQINSYFITPDLNKKTGVTKPILKQMKEADHAFSTSSQCLLGAIIRGFYPVASDVSEFNSTSHKAD